MFFKFMLVYFSPVVVRDVFGKKDFGVYRKLLRPVILISYAL